MPKKPLCHINVKKHACIRRHEQQKATPTRSRLPWPEVAQMVPQRIQSWGFKRLIVINVNRNRQTCRHRIFQVKEASSFLSGWLLIALRGIHFRRAVWQRPIKQPPAIHFQQVHSSAKKGRLCRVTTLTYRSNSGEI